jgi:hypothetical protein
VKSGEHRGYHQLAWKRKYTLTANRMSNSVNSGGGQGDTQYTQNAAGLSALYAGLVGGGQEVTLLTSPVAMVVHLCVRPAGRVPGREIGG